MIKPVQQRGPQQPSTEVSSAQGKQKTEAASSQTSMQGTAGNIQKLAQSLPFGAGKHSFSDSPTNPNLVDRTGKVVENVTKQPPAL